MQHQKEHEQPLSPEPTIDPKLVLSRIHGFWLGLLDGLSYTEVTEDIKAFLELDVQPYHPQFVQRLLSNIVLNPRQRQQYEDTFHRKWRPVSGIDYLGHTTPEVGPDLVSRKKAEIRAKKLVTNR